MGTKNDVIVGAQFGKWTVLEREVKNPNSKAKRVRKGAYCQCECGTLRYLEYRQLYDGRSKSCGCEGHKIVAQKRYNANIIPIGTQFGELTVIGDAGMYQNKHHSLCKCSCGNEIKVSNTHLKMGHTKSCGCIKSHGEKKIKQILLENNINFISEYTIPELKTEKGGYLRFDFALFKNNSLYKIIEFNGIQHYEPLGWASEEVVIDLQRRDSIKINYCKEHNIPLQIIKYDEIDKIDLEFLISIENKSSED